jgi:hypothetical protein
LDGLLSRNWIHYRRSKSRNYSKNSKSNTFYEGGFGNISLSASGARPILTQEMTLCIDRLEITQAKKREFICHSSDLAMLQVKFKLIIAKLFIA